MKILFFTDTHIRASNPRSRIDDFFQATMDKLEEIKNYANENNVDFCIHGGDLFDRPDTAIRTSSDVGRLLGQFNMPIYGVIGNHDIYGYNQNTIDRSMMGLLSNLSIIKLIPEEGILIEKDGIKVLLLGRNYSSTLDLDKENYIVRKKDLRYEADYIINVVHGFLAERPFIKHVPHVLVGEIYETDADITLAGHYHSGFPLQEHDGKYFINPGSMMRLSNSLSEIKRRPKFLLINIDKEGIKIEDRFLKTAKSGDQVLDRTLTEEDQFRQDRMMIFADSIHQNINLEMMNLDRIIEEIAQSEEFDIKVREEAKLRLDNAKGRINALD